MSLNIIISLLDLRAGIQPLYTHSLFIKAIEAKTEHKIRLEHRSKRMTFATITNDHTFYNTALRGDWENSEFVTQRAQVKELFNAQTDLEK